MGDPINRPGDKASSCCPGASSLKQLHVALKATRRDQSPQDLCQYRHMKSVQPNGQRALSRAALRVQHLRRFPPVHRNTRTPTSLETPVLHIGLRSTPTERMEYAAAVVACRFKECRMGRAREPCGDASITGGFIGIRPTKAAAAVSVRHARPLIGCRSNPKLRLAISSRHPWASLSSKP